MSTEMASAAGKNAARRPHPRKQTLQTSAA